MAFVQNGKYETISHASGGGITNTSDTNPFGLKDFSKMLDNKFGNSAFSDNLLAAPPGNVKNMNPFDVGKYPKPNINDYFGNKNNPYSIKGKPTTPPIDSNHSGGGGKPEIDQGPASIFDGMQINKGTGMAQGGRVRHKLDFCY